MSAFAWTEVVEDLSPRALTLLAQAISPNDNGNLKWDMFFPKQEVESVDLQSVEAINFRPVSDRREWNQRGRLIPSKTPDFKNISIVPIEGNYLWGEYELQKLNEPTVGNAAIVAEQMQITVPKKVLQITRANYRRIEVDAFTAWALGTVTQRNPQNAAETFVADFAFDGSRYQTAGTAWNDPGLNSYDLLMAWIDDAIDAMGSFKGVVCRRNFVREVLADAPDLAGGAKMTWTQLEDRIQQDKGTEFAFYPMEDTVDSFTDGGTATSSAKVWTAEKIAAVPAGTSIGYTAFAPVVRAMEIARSLPNSGVDINGQTVYYEEHNNGRELSVEVQVNALSVPLEANVFVMDVGF